MVHGPCSADQLAAGVHMSAPAIHRHLHKLQRRTVVAFTAGPPNLWRLVRPTGFACRQQLLDIVLRTLKDATRSLAT